MVVDALSAKYRLIAKVLAEDFEADAEIVLAGLHSGRSFNVFTKGRDFIKIDVFPKDEPIDRAAFERVRSFDVAGITVHVISPEELVLAKLQWARVSHSDAQLRDIKSLLDTALDLTYVESRARQLGLAELLDEARSL